MRAEGSRENLRPAEGEDFYREGEDFYYEGAFVVFTARYHLRRGYCCRSGCRHCPYRDEAEWEDEKTHE